MKEVLSPLKKYKNIIISAAAVLLVLAFAFWYGSGTPSFHGFSVPKTEEKAETAVTTPEKTDKSETDLSKKPQKADGTHMTAEEKTALAEKMAEEKPQDEKNPPAAAAVTESTPAAAEQGKEGNKDPTCTLSVRCDSILNHMDWLDKEKVELVPPDGVIYAEREVSFHEGESVFDVLLREMKNSQIHMEFENTPLYKSAYIEGIANLYEFDCGELSGWMYRVNGVFPNFGCSKYILKDGDKIEWLYTCDLGADIGGGTF